MHASEKMPTVENITKSPNLKQGSSGIGVRMFQENVLRFDVPVADVIPVKAGYGNDELEDNFSNNAFR